MGYQKINKVDFDFSAFDKKSKNLSLVRKIVRLFTRGALIEMETLREFLKQACVNMTFRESYEQNGWIIFRPYTDKDFYVLVYNSVKFGLLAVIPKSNSIPQEIIEKAIALNASGNLQKQAILPFAEPLTLRYKVNASPAIDVIWSASQIEGRKRDYIFYQPQAQFPENRYYDLYDMMKNWSGSDDQNKMVDRGGDFYNTYPVKNNVFI